MLWANRPIEKRNIRTGRGFAVGEEEVIGAHIVLINRFLDQTQAKKLRVEIMIAFGVGRNSRQMMNALKLHNALSDLKFLIFIWPLARFNKSFSSLHGYNECLAGHPFGGLRRIEVSR